MSPPHTPTKLKRVEYDTPHRSRFFYAYFNRKNGQTLTKICRLPRIEIPRTTAQTWLRKYEIEGSPA